MSVATNTLVGAGFALLSYARRHEIDLGTAGLIFGAELERAAPGLSATLDRLAAAPVRSSGTHKAVTGFWGHNVRTGVSIWSPGVYELLGLRIGSCKPSYERFRDCLHPDDVAVVEAELLRSAARQAPFRLLYRVRRRKQHRWIEDNGHWLFDEKGVVIGKTGIATEMEPIDHKGVVAFIPNSRNAEGG